MEEREFLVQVEQLEVEHILVKKVEQRGGSSRRQIIEEEGWVKRIQEK